MTILREKEQLLEMAIKLGRLTRKVFDLDYIYWYYLDNNPVFYLQQMKFVKTDNGWISYIMHDIRCPREGMENEPDINYEINEFNCPFIIETREVVTQPTHDLQELFRQTVNAKLTFLTEQFFDIYNRKKELKRRLERVDELEGKYKLNRERKNKYITQDEEYLDDMENTINNLLKI